MASNFRVWVDNPDATSANPNVETEAAFIADTSRAQGFKSGDVVSALKVNSILRQNSLIAVALVEAFLSNSTIGLLSSVDDVKTEMLASIALKADLTSLSASLTSLTGRVGTLETGYSNLSSTVSGLLSGSTSSYNALRLGGNLPAYYQKAITSGTSNPSGGVDGDIYIKYS